MSLHDVIQGIASRSLRRQRSDHTLWTADLVAEAWLRVRKACPATYGSSGEFLAYVARTMRSILVDHARMRNRTRRARPGGRVPLDEVVEGIEAGDLDLEALDVLLVELKRRGKAASRAVLVFEYRFFVGLAFDEIAKLLGSSVGAVHRDWTFARAWLAGRLR